MPNLVEKARTPSGGLLLNTGDDPYIMFPVYDERKVLLDGVFTPDQLRALADHVESADITKVEPSELV